MTSYIIEILIKSSVLVGMSWLLIMLMKRQTAVMRHWLISLSFVGLLILPLAVVIMPDLAVIPGESYRDMVAYVGNPSENISPKTNAHIEELVVSEVNTSAQTSENAFYVNWPIVLIGIWLIGAIILLARIILGWARIRSITKRAKDWNSSYLDKNGVSLKYSDEITVPMTWGWLRPVILIPEYMLDLPKEEIQTILQHERVHIRRKDYLFHILALLASSLYWFNPLVLMLKNRLVLEREKACDECVVNEGHEAENYARHLVDITRKFKAQQTSQTRLAVALAQISQTKTRVLALLSGRMISLPGKAQLAKMGTLFISFVPLMAALAPVEDISLVKELETMVQDTGIVAETKAFEAITNIEDESQASMERIVPQISTLDISENIASASNFDHRLPQNISLQSLPVAQDQKNGKMTSWKKGKSDFKVWTYGELTLSETSPYITFQSPGAMIVIEERKGGTKSNKLMLSPAPYDGGLIHNFMHGKPNAWSGYEENDILPFWYKNDEWVLLGKGKNSWMRNHMREVVMQLREDDAMVNEEEHDLWWAVIETHQEIKTNRYWPRKYFESVREKEKITLEKAPSLDELPLLDRASIAFSGSRRRDIGRTKATKVSSGFSGFTEVRGTRFGTVLPFSGTRAKIEQIHIHLKMLSYKSLKLAVDFYKVKDGEVQGKINRKASVIEVSEDKGWSSHLLNDKDLIIDSDILVTLEILDAEGKGKAIFLSLADDAYPSLERITGQNGWDLREGNYAWYLTVSEE